MVFCVNERDYKILNLHGAGKSFSYIARKFNVTKEYIQELIMKSANGYNLCRK